MIKKLIKRIVQLLCALAIIFVFIFTFLYITEYRPKDEEVLNLSGKSSDKLVANDEIKILTYNIGYLGLDANEDFFKVGGKSTRPSAEEKIYANLTGVNDVITFEKCDIVLLQEVDYKARRSYYINEYRKIADKFNGTSSYAITYKSFVPYPVFDMVGKVNSGMVTLSKFDAVAKRIWLSSAYSFPERLFLPKRALLVEEIPIEESDKKLVVINVHMEAFDDGNTRKDQMNRLKQLMEEEYGKGNYVVVGGDFNQVFPVADNTKYPLIDTTIYTALKIPDEFLPDGWNYAIDDSFPTNRVAKSAYTGNYEKDQVYVIDGFVVSPNIEVKEVKTIDTKFEYSDHNPVSIKIKLK